MIYKSVFKKFSNLEGSDHIATEYALYGIEKIIVNNNVKSVFEFGIGIGTIPYLVKNINKEIYYAGTEENEFCINQLNKNLNKLKDHEFDHYKTLKGTSRKFDLIIVDGKINDETIIKGLCSENSIIFIEGDRKDQCEIIHKTFPDALRSRCISLKKNYIWSPFKVGYQGGYTIFRINNKKVFNLINYYLEKILTAIKFRIRKIKN